MGGGAAYQWEGGQPNGGGDSTGNWNINLTLNC